MKHILIACALIMATGFSAAGFAGQHKNIEGMQERHMQRMAAELDLTAEQQDQIGRINNKYAKQYRELSQAHREEVSSLLSKEQQEKMQTLREERREKMARQPGRYKDQRGMNPDSDN